ncbi:MAG: TonB-dependent receptor [Bacteroidetes bacterium]|nr:TonB-dependent receptor [Bacteroidota bacterium]
MRKFLLLTILSLFFTSLLHASTTGKISGTVIDSKTNEPLIGVSVLIEGTNQGASTNVDGYYVILNVSPGTYTLKATYIGYASATITNVRVNIDQTTNIDISMTEKALVAGEVVVVAQQPVVQKDVAASRVNLSMAEIENLPVANIQSVVTLQAGILSTSTGPQIRGGSSDETAYIVNGLTLRDERDNTPYTGISFTAVKEIQVQTGGFSAEFGNIRSGLVNIVTREGDKQKYSISIVGRYKSAARKQFGDAVNSMDSYWIRPYVDPAVCWTGTDNGAWGDYTKRQYQSFRGWNKVSQQLLADSDPTNDLTPQAAQQLFLWQHRRQLDIVKPDYDMDMSFSGPVPFVSKELGDMTFIASYRSTQEMYVIPLSTDAYRDYNFQIRLTSNIGDGMKLSLEGISGKQWGTNSSRTGGPGIFRSSSGIAEQLDWRSGASYLDSRLYAPEYWDPSEKFITAFGLKFTHVISSSTYYDVYLNEFGTRYSTNPANYRDLSKTNSFGGVLFDEAPFGYYSGTSSGIGSSMNMGLGFSNSRDTSKISTWSMKFDFVSQLDKYNNLKAGFEFVYSDNGVNYALREPSLPSNDSQSKWRTFPVRGALYVQDKLEFEGMIANLGLRLDYSNANGDWYVIDNPFTKAFAGANVNGMDTLIAKSPAKKIFDLSPRLSVAFPISVDSKLYFNYGHFRSMPIPEDLYLLRRSSVTQAVTRLADPNNPLPKTVAYELGYEHNLFDEYLIRLAGYYKDVSLEPRLVRYTSRDNLVSYLIPEPDSYSDVRGFEATVTKNRGEWIRGFINYTYEVITSGNFGLPNYSENPAIQREYDRTRSFFVQNKPIPRPYARANVDIFTPLDWGPEIAGIKPFEDLRINLLASWRSGRYFTWTGPGGVAPGHDNNIQWKDTWGLDARISKAFNIGRLNLEFFADIYNVLNLQQLDFQAGFFNQSDYDDYMKSLHLPEAYREFGNGYNFVAGNDKPGDIRTGPYIPWDNNASDAQKAEWTKNKSYIDMPNLSYTGMLNPRSIYWGLKINYDLN